MLVEQGQRLPEASMEATRFLSAASKLYRNNVEERLLKSLSQLAWGGFVPSFTSFAQTSDLWSGIQEGIACSHFVEPEGARPGGC